MLTPCPEYVNKTTRFSAFSRDALNRCHRTYTLNRPHLGYKRWREKCAQRICSLQNTVKPILSTQTRVRVSVKVPRPTCTVSAP